MRSPQLVSFPRALFHLASSRLLLVVVILALAPTVNAATHAFTLVNDDAVPAVRVEAAPHGTSEFQPLDTAGPLQGGRTVQVAAAFPNGVCAVDVRVSYADRGPVLIGGWNVCREPTLYLGQSRRAGLRQVDGTTAILTRARPTAEVPHD